jgi:hypothetical protein
VPEASSDHTFVNVPQCRNLQVRNLCSVFVAVLWGAMLLAACVLAVRGMLAQSAGSSNVLGAASSNVSRTTEARLKAPGWWPTKAVRSRDEYVGAAECAKCHASQAAVIQSTAMNRAATRAPESESLRQNEHLALQIGPYQYQITSSGGKNVLRISKAGASVSAVLGWAFGMGRIAQTYVYEQNGSFYESHLSFYTAPQALDITPGHPRTVPPSLVEGAGRRMTIQETRRCFGCHTTGSTAKNPFDPQTLVLGVTCEACHGPGGDHVAAAKSGMDELVPGSIVNPARMNPVESVDFCGACHRTWQDVVSDSPVRTGTLNVRFTPYRLENSRCWNKGDARITCLACHDPHQPLVLDPASYDSRCLQCHTAAGTKKSEDHSGTACPVGIRLCVTCHMPKFRNPLLHATFTDHWIRIAPPGAPLPD